MLSSLHSMHAKLVYLSLPQLIIPLQSAWQAISNRFVLVFRAAAQLLECMQGQMLHTWSWPVRRQVHTLWTPSLLLLMFLSACVRTRLMSLPCRRWRKLNTTLAVHCNKIYKKIRKNDPDGHSKLSNTTVRRSFALRKWLALPRYVVGAVLAVKILRRAIALREA